MSQLISSLEIPGLGQEDIATLPNARNFEYFRDMVRMYQKCQCPFCDPMDPVKNPIIRVSDDGDMRTWACPKDYRAKNLTKHYVTASKRHAANLSNYTCADFANLWSLTGSVIRELEGNQLFPHFGQNDVGVDGVHVLVVVPKGTHRVEATFNNEPNPNPGMTKTRFIKAASKWSCLQCPVDETLESKFIIMPDHTGKGFQYMADEDFASISVLISYLTSSEGAYHLPVGAVMMGLPGAALVMRFGEMKRNAGSIRHQHCNVMLPDATGIVQATLAKDAAKIAAKMEVLAVWNKMRLHLEWRPEDTEQDAMKTLEPADLALLTERK